MSHTGQLVILAATAWPARTGFIAVRNAYRCRQHVIAARRNS